MLGDPSCCPRGVGHPSIYSRERPLIYERSKMHFGKTVDAEFAKIDAGVAPFPYNKMKRSLKSLLSCKSAEAVQGKFIGDLSNAVRRCDSAWVAACRRTLQPRGFRSIMRSKQHSDSIEMAQRLDAWAELAQEGVRKILKKYNKIFGSGCGKICIQPAVQVAFFRSTTKTEIRALARSRDEPSSDKENLCLDCPVCLDTVVDPVGAVCGHAMCRECFASLESHVRSTYQNVARDYEAWQLTKCPICRNATGKPQPMPVLRSLACKEIQVELA